MRFAQLSLEEFIYHLFFIRIKITTQSYQRTRLPAHLVTCESTPHLWFHCAGHDGFLVKHPLGSLALTGVDELSAWIHYYYHTHVFLEKDSRILNFFTAHTIV